MQDPLSRMQRHLHSWEVWQKVRLIELSLGWIQLDVWYELQSTPKLDLDYHEVSESHPSALDTYIGIWYIDSTTTTLLGSKCAPEIETKEGFHDYQHAWWASVRGV